MSIEAIKWVLNEAPIPRDRRDASSLTIVLLGLANHAGSDGCNAFPAIATLVRYSRLCERSVQNALRALEELKLIEQSDPEIVAAYVKRADRRPQGWNLLIHSGAQTVHPADQHGVQTRPHGVQTATPRGAAAAPEPSLNRPKNRPSRERAQEGARPSQLPPVCGRCDARESDPVSARVVWLDADRTRSERCTRCHPAAINLAGAA